MSEASSGGQPATYDLIVVGDQVVLGDEARPAAVAIRGERIAELLDVEQARKPGLAGRSIDAWGKICRSVSV